MILICQCDMNDNTVLVLFIYFVILSNDYRNIVAQ
jgi:hypothetical protein